ncbi:MAG: DNA topoisomerase IV subunit A [Bacillota bacterium]|jgi:topoisomerase-4 subunit A|nr:DNA topoisomerase IV subunit A [Bacillota bacterium]MDY0118251.1 DNA topoisomerase IV subunit A [Bacilli bacterium]
MSKKTKKTTKKVVKEPQIEEHIIEMPMEEIMGDRFGLYAKEVIQNRAIPDVRDGLKPVQRRIVYCMYDEGNIHTKPTRKCAHSVGAVMGRYHPHGDSSIYEALARLSQPWNLRYPLIDFQGNNGSIDGDAPASYRYTEARLNELSELLTRDIDKNTVDKQLTFDDVDLEPVVLPSRFPNLLLNGSQGIAVAVATEIPPHNMKEVIEAIIYRITHKKATIEDLREFIKGPDFPTGGIVYKSDGLDKIYTTGRGRIEIEARWEIVNEDNLQKMVITEIPYQVNKSIILRDIGNIIEKKAIDGLLELRDESDRKGLRIVVDLRKDANSEVITEYLLNKTLLRTSYNANVVAIADNRPQTLNLLQLVDYYIDHQVDVIRRRSEFDLERLLKRLHIVDGLMKAISILDDVVKLIRKSNDKANAKENLIEAFDFTAEQAEAILTMQLYRLSNTDITTLVNEKDSIEKEITNLREILANENALNRVLINDLKEISKKFGDDRRTSIRERGEIIEIDKRDLIADEDVMIAITRDGYLKRSSMRSYVSSGENALPGIKSGDLLVMADEANNKDTIIVFTNKGNYCYIPVYTIHEGRWKDEGKHLNYIVTLSPDEKLIKAFVIKEFRDDLYFTMVTGKGRIKRSLISEFTAIRFSRPLICIRLSKGDYLVDVVATSGNSDLVVVTRNGSASYYNENEVSPLSLKAAGVKAISRLKNDAIVGLVSVHPGEKIRLGILTNKGHVRLVDVNHLEITARLGKMQYVMRSFKSDVHNVVGVLAIDKTLEDSLIAYNLTDNNNLVPVVIDDVKLTATDKYAKQNIDQLGKGEVFVGLYRMLVRTISAETKAYEPVIQTEVATIKTIEKSTKRKEVEYEQMSIFDILEDD